MFEQIKRLGNSSKVKIDLNLNYKISNWFSDILLISNNNVDKLYQYNNKHENFLFNVLFSNSFYDNEQMSFSSSIIITRWVYQNFCLIVFCEYSFKLFWMGHDDGIIFVEYNSCLVSLFVILLCDVEKNILSKH